MESCTPRRVSCFVVNKLLLSVVNGLSRMRAFAVYTTLRYVMIGVSLGVCGVLDLQAVHLPIIWTITEGTLLLVLLVETFVTIKFFSAAPWAHWVSEHIR